MCDVVDATVDRIMNKEVATVSPSTLLQEAVRKMNALRIGCLVVESEGEPVGIITERDNSHWLFVRHLFATDSKDPSLLRQVPFETQCV